MASGHAPETLVQAGAPGPTKTAAAGSAQWIKGKHYFEIGPPPVRNPKRTEVAEIFSYACRGCALFHAAEGDLSAWIPKDARARYIPAGFGGTDGFSIYQRAFLVAQRLGVPPQAHAAMFKRVWPDGPLSGKHGPSLALEDMAEVYARFGIAPKRFMAEARSPATDQQMKTTDRRIASYGVTSLPTIIVGGQYRLSPASAGGHDEAVQLTRWLVAKLAAQRAGSR